MTVYTDGACLGNPGPGGWAAIISEAGVEREVSGAAPASTNQRMELTAVLEALRAIPGRRRVHVYSDSAYVVNCFRDRWHERWARTGWRNAGRQEVANRDLWEPLIAETGRHDVVWHKVRGHSGDPMNERVDRLAREVAESLAGGGGDHGAKTSREARPPRPGRPAGSATDEPPERRSDAPPVVTDAAIRSLLGELRSGLRALYGSRVHGIVLYGSYARQAAREGSDLDVAVILDRFDRPWPEIERTGPLVADLSLKYGVTVSLIPVRKLDWDLSRTRLARSLHRDGVPVE